MLAGFLDLVPIGCASHSEQTHDVLVGTALVPGFGRRPLGTLVPPSKPPPRCYEPFCRESILFNVYFSQVLYDRRLSGRCIYDRRLYASMIGAYQVDA